MSVVPNIYTPSPYPTIFPHTLLYGPSDTAKKAESHVGLLKSVDDVEQNRRPGKLSANHPFGQSSAVGLEYRSSTTSRHSPSPQGCTIGSTASRLASDCSRHSLIFSTLIVHCKKCGVPSTPIVVHTYGVHAHHTSSGVPGTPRLWCTSTPVFYAHY